MFKFLKEKVQSVISSISKKIEEKSKQDILNEISEEIQKPIEEVKEEFVKKKEVIKTKSEAPVKVVGEVKKEVEVSPKKEIAEEITLAVPESKRIEAVKPVPVIIPERKIEIEEQKEEVPKKGFFSKVKEKFTKKEEQQREVKEEVKVETKDPVKEEKGLFKTLAEKITTRKIAENEFNELFWELELVLLESSVALEVIEKIKEDLKIKLVNQPLKRNEISMIIVSSLKESIAGLFDISSFYLLERAKTKKPLVICLVGINGSGKTTTIAKLAHYFKKNKVSCVLAAADTFRAAAIAQLEEHAVRLGVKMIKHEYGSDPAAVAFDAIKHAEARGIDVVLVDTAGRLHSNEDLMNEMKKIVRVAKPDLKIFIGESITGNDCVEQARGFDEAIGIDGIILAKADIDEKGGAAISISYVTKKPILFLGTGQSYDDLEKFNAMKLLEKLGL